MGSGTLEFGLFRSERYEFEERTSDPAVHLEGEAWIRTDIAPNTNQIATLRADTGTGTIDIPIFDVAASAPSEISKAWRVRVGGTTGFIPTVQNGGSYDEIRLQHNGTWHGAHDSLSVIPDSDLTQYSLTDPDNRITVTSSDSYEARLNSGANDVSRLFDNTPLSEFPDTFRWEFTVNIISMPLDGQTTGFYWSDSDDATITNSTNLAGGSLWASGLGSRRYILGTRVDGSGSGDYTLVADNLSEADYTIQMDYDQNAEEISGRVIDNTGSIIGEATRNYTSATYQYHYPHQAQGDNFGTAGKIDIDYKNQVFKPL